MYHIWLYMAHAHIKCKKILYEIRRKKILYNVQHFTESGLLGILSTCVTVFSQKTSCLAEGGLQGFFLYSF